MNVFPQDAGCLDRIRHVVFVQWLALQKVLGWSHSLNILVNALLNVYAFTMNVHTSHSLL